MRNLPAAGWSMVL